MLIVALVVLTFVALLAVSGLAPKPAVDGDTFAASTPVNNVLPTPLQPTHETTSTAPPTPTAAPTPTTEPTPTAEPTPTPTLQPTPTPTPSPTPTPTSEPTPTPPAAPQANFTGTIQSDGLTVKWQDLSSGDVTHWSWDFGDGKTSYAQNPSHTYAAYGDYSVTITVRGPGGQDTRTKVLHLRVAPTANFTGVIQADGLTVNWQDLSTGYITHWRWDFGDDTTSTARNPSHTYAAPGDYQVRLTVRGAGSHDSRTKVLHL